MSPVFPSLPDSSFVMNEQIPQYTVSGSFSRNADATIVSGYSEDNVTPIPDSTTSTAMLSKKTITVVKKKPNNKKFHARQCQKWQERFYELLAFREKYGHCLVPHKYEANPPLAGWVKRQRYQYTLYLEGKQSTITDERIRILNNFGFVWDSHEAVWQERLRDLQAFREEHGTCAIPCHYHPNPKLGTWAKCQRRQYKLYKQGLPCNIDAKRIMTLEALGFEWNGSRPKATQLPKAEISRGKEENNETTSLNDYDIMLDVLSILSDDDVNQVTNVVREQQRATQLPAQPSFSIDPQQIVEDLPGYMSDLSDVEW